MLNSDCKYRDLVNCELLSELPLHAPNVNKFSESMLQKPWKNGTVCSIDETSKIDFYMCVTYLQNHKDFFFSSQSVQLEFFVSCTSGSINVSSHMID